jgi:Protein of unknown function (DUF3551)
MRMLRWTILAVATLPASAPATAQRYDPHSPVCLQKWGQSGATAVDCSYTSLEQCRATASGLSATCYANPYWPQADQVSPGRVHRRQGHGGRPSGPKLRPATGGSALCRAAVSGAAAGNGIFVVGDSRPKTCLRDETYAQRRKSRPHRSRKPAENGPFRRQVFHGEFRWCRMTVEHGKLHAEIVELSVEN